MNGIFDAENVLSDNHTGQYGGVGEDGKNSIFLGINSFI